MGSAVSSLWLADPRWQVLGLVAARGTAAVATTTQDSYQHIGCYQRQIGKTYTHPWTMYRSLLPPMMPTAPTTVLVIPAGRLWRPRPDTAAPSETDCLHPYPCPCQGTYSSVLYRFQFRFHVLGLAAACDLLGRPSLRCPAGVIPIEPVRPPLRTRGTSARLQDALLH